MPRADCLLLRGRARRCPCQFVTSVKTSAADAQSMSAPLADHLKCTDRVTALMSRWRDRPRRVRRGGVSAVAGGFRFGDQGFG